MPRVKIDTSAANETMPHKCSKCGKSFLEWAEMEDTGKCVDCAANDAKAKPEPRPTLEVEMEVHQNLKPRIYAHIGRMRAWDLRNLDASRRAGFQVALDSLSAAFALLEHHLLDLRSVCFVAKTTPATRLAAKLSHGARVSLREDQRQVFAAIYSDEQLDSLSVVRTTETHVQLMSDDGSNIGLVPMRHVVPKETT